MISRTSYSIRITTTTMALALALCFSDEFHEIMTSSAGPYTEVLA